MRSRTRTPLIAILAFIGVLWSGGFALAEDYSVDIGVETNAGWGAGTFTCRFDQRCEAKIESLKLKVMVDFSRSHPLAHIRLESRDMIGCCYFVHGASSRTIDPEIPLSREAFFKGISAGSSAFLVENERVGTLYLKFHYSVIEKQEGFNQ